MGSCHLPEQSYSPIPILIYSTHRTLCCVATRSCPMDRAAHPCCERHTPIQPPLEGGMCDLTSTLLSAICNIRPHHPNSPPLPACLPRLPDIRFLSTSAGDYVSRQ